MDRRRNNACGFFFLAIWVVMVIFLGLCENYKLRFQGDKKQTNPELNFPQPLVKEKIVEVDLSELN